MMPEEPSRTAQGVALLRAAHQFIDGEPKILVDPIAPRLFPPEAIDKVIEHAERLQEPGALMLRSHVLIRSRYAEDMLEHAVARGVGQYIILGAGWDTFAYRQPAWTHELHIFEVDQPASQQDKLQRLATAGIAIPVNVTHIPLDFETTALADGLRAGGVDLAAPAFIAWLGVMMYLTLDAIDNVFRFVASMSQGSEIVFTFAAPAPDGRPSLIAERAAQQGEPWQTYFTPDDLIAYLRGFGLHDITLPTPEELAARYIGARADGLSTALRRNIARVVV